jgi:hypothetical protein
MAKHIYHGLAPDTDPRYSSGWTIISAPNLNPSYVEKLRKQSKREERAGGPSVMPRKGPGKSQPPKG